MRTYCNDCGFQSFQSYLRFDQDLKLSKATAVTLREQKLIDALFCVAWSVFDGEDGLHVLLPKEISKRNIEREFFLLFMIQCVFCEAFVYTSKYVYAPFLVYEYRCRAGTLSLVR